MRFPLSYDSLRLRTAATFAYHDDSKMAPDNYDPAREMVALLVNTEESLIQRDDKLYLNWGKLRLATIFEQVLNLIELGGAYLEQDMQPTLEVSGFFANHQFLEEYQETAKYHFLRAFKDLAGYDTELCKEFAVGLTIPDLKHSYEVYSRDIAPLPDFDTEMRALLGEKYEEVLELATREPFDREQRFPLFLEDLRRRALKDFKAGVEDSEGAPADYSPGDDIVKVLQEQEHSLLLKENNVYLDWGKL